MSSAITWDDLIHVCTSPLNLACDTPAAEVPRLWDGDEIAFTHQDGLGIGASEVGIAFRNAEAIRWWKEVQVVNASGRRVASVGAQDDDHALKFTSHASAWTTSAGVKSSSRRRKRSASTRACMNSPLPIARSIPWPARGSLSRGRETDSGRRICKGAWGVPVGCFYGLRPATG